MGHDGGVSGDPPSPRAVAAAGVVLGLGASRGCPAGELAALVDRALAEAGAAREDVVAVATATIKADEPAILAIAEALGVPLRLLEAAELAAVDVPTPSAVVASHVGTPSVAEASALLVAGEIGVATGDASDPVVVLRPAARLLVEKRRSPHATCAVATATPIEVLLP